MHTIYGLFDPRNGHLRYIGRTKNVSQRYKAHCGLGDAGKRKNAWVEELRNNGLLPEMRELDTADDETVTEVENFYIGYFKMLGAELTNGECHTPFHKPKKDNKEAINIRLSPWIIDAIDKASIDSAISRSAWISWVCTDALRRRGYIPD